MKFVTTLDPADIQAVQTLVQEMNDHPFVQSRITRNINPVLPNVNPTEMWQAMLMCLITTRNKSGYGSAVDNFLCEKPFRLALETCRNTPKPMSLIENALSSLRIQRWKISADFAFKNLNALENGGWKSLEIWRDCLYQQRFSTASAEHYQLERQAARAAQKLLIGLGPKQSRNFWQELGLFRFETPIDARVVKWFSNTFGLYISVSGLSDELYYCQVMDVIRELCEQAGVLPCLLDATIFASFEK